MTDTKHVRTRRPDTGEDWRALGFYHEPDIAHREWRLVGSRSGLRTLARMLASQADKANAGGTPAALPIGPYEDFQIRIWERAGIDDESIHGPPDALHALSQLIDERLAVTQPDDEFRIRDEFGRDVEYGLVFVVKHEEFDPASLMPAVEPVDVPEKPGPPPMYTAALAFYFYDVDWSGAETAGLVRVERDDVVFEYQTTDALGLSKSEVEVVTLPLDRLSSVKFKRGVFSAHILIQARDMKSLEKVPTSAQGSVRLYFKRRDRDDAEQLANILHALAEDTG